MKKLFRLVLGCSLLILILFSGYYFYILSSDGKNRIKYIEPDIPYSSFREIMQNPVLKGKTVYVDFWHTGCGPCLIEFQSLPSLKKKFENYSDRLVYLYIGVDRSVPGEEFRWKRMIENKGVTGYHYFVSKEFFRQLWEETVMVDSISPRFPHYLIVDEKGVVINDNAPRPSSEKIYQELDDVLKSRI